MTEPNPYQSPQTDANEDGLAVSNTRWVAAFICLGSAMAITALAFAVLLLVTRPLATWLDFAKPALIAMGLGCAAFAFFWSRTGSAFDRYDQVRHKRRELHEVVEQTRAARRGVTESRNAT